DEVRILFGNELTIKKQPITEVLPPFGEIANVEEAEELVIQELWNVPAKPDAVRGEGLNEDSDLTPPPRTASAKASVLFALYNHLIQALDFKSFTQRILEPIEGVLTDAEIAAQLLPAQGVWSPTYLEEYAECPYRFFAHRGLNLESQAEGIDIRRRGTILHDVLEYFFTWQRDQNKSGKEVSFEKARDFCLQKFKELWEKEPLKGDRYYKIELERKNMQEMILEILRTELIEKKPPIPGLIPAYFEYEFKDLVLKGKDREIRLRGKIDRLDTDPSGRYGLVIDYKTGKQFKMSFLESGVFLQLPFYLMAAREKLGLKPLGGHLYSLSKAKSSGFHHEDHLNEAGISTSRKKKSSLSGKDFEKYLERSVLFAERFVGEIEQAKIPVRPRDCVSYCSYSAVCRIEKWRLDHLYQEIAEEDR
ncbi:MAG: PD-(D/E)XK nuclease family protein, partial [bacterium]|nr:PD-(D/E)XK nuclease family protein [bacterium]